MRRPVGLAVALALLASGCGHSRPTAAELLRFPLVPAVLPAGYVLSRVDERVNGRYVPSASEDPEQGRWIEDGGRWFDFTFRPRSARPQDFEQAVSLHEFLDVESATASLGSADRRTLIRGHSAVCASDRVLRWAEKRTVQIAIGGAGLGCEDLRHVAESLDQVEVPTWEAYRRSARDQ